MYAIVRTGGKQYRVQPGDVIRIEKLNVETGKELDLTEVLFVGGDKTFVGEPTVKNAKVTVVVTRQHRGPKVIFFKKKRRQGYRRLGGHRQPYTEIFIKTITTPEGSINADSKANVYDPEKKKERIERLTQYREEQKQAMRKEGDAPSETKTAKTKAPKKVAAKKASAGKKSSGAKKATKKPAAKKATTKKKAD